MPSATQDSITKTKPVVLHEGKLHARFVDANLDMHGVARGCNSGLQQLDKRQTWDRDHRMVGDLLCQIYLPIMLQPGLCLLGLIFDCPLRVPVEKKDAQESRNVVMTFANRAVNYLNQQLASAPSENVRVQWQTGKVELLCPWAPWTPKAKQSQRIVAVGKVGDLRAGLRPGPVPRAWQPIPESLLILHRHHLSNLLAHCLSRLLFGRHGLLAQKAGLLVRYDACLPPLIHGLDRLPDNLRQTATNTAWIEERAPASSLHKVDPPMDAVRRRGWLPRWILQGAGAGIGEGEVACVSYARNCPAPIWAVVVSRDTDIILLAVLQLWVGQCHSRLLLQLGRLKVDQDQEPPTYVQPSLLLQGVANVPALVRLALLGGSDYVKKKDILHRVGPKAILRACLVLTVAARDKSAAERVKAMAFGSLQEFSLCLALAHQTTSICEVGPGQYRGLRHNQRSQHLRSRAGSPRDLRGAARVLMTARARPLRKQSGDPKTLAPTLHSAAKYFRRFRFNLLYWITLQGACNLDLCVHAPDLVVRRPPDTLPALEPATQQQAAMDTSQ